MVEIYLVKGRQKSRQTELQKSPGHGGFTSPSFTILLLARFFPVLIHIPIPTSGHPTPYKQNRTEQKRKRAANIIAPRLLPLHTRNHQLALLKKITKLPLSSAVH
jgi:hypothetical protein